ncbi:hypothetical protein [Parvibaculum lavamentivorans]|nr:hypothetical protein [Parvibaculum lavamentivorans]
MNARVTAFLPGLVFTARDAEKPGAPLLVPLWVALGIAGGAALLPVYGGSAWALPALAFLVLCPLAVAGVLLAEGADAPAE